MAGSAMVFTYDNGHDHNGHRSGIRKVIADWTSDDSDGTASGTTEKIVGRLIKIVAVPGDTAPDSGWDVAVLDESGADVTAQCFQTTLGSGDDAEAVETFLYLSDLQETAVAVPVFPVVCDKLTIGVANAGNSKTGQVILYYSLV